MVHFGSSWCPGEAGCGRPWLLGLSGCWEPGPRGLQPPRGLTASGFLLEPPPLPQSAHQLQSVRGFLRQVTEPGLHTPGISPPAPTLPSSRSPSLAGLSGGAPELEAGLDASTLFEGFMGQSWEDLGERPGIHLYHCCPGHSVCRKARRGTLSAPMTGNRTEKGADRNSPGLGLPSS